MWVSIWGTADQPGKIGEIVIYDDATLEEIARSPVTIPIPGFKSVAQVEDNAKALDFGPLSDEQMAEIDRLLRR